MAYRRRSTRRRRGTRRNYGRRRPRYTTRRTRMYRRPNYYHTYDRMTSVTNVVLTSNTTGLGGSGFLAGAATFRLSDLINVSEFTNLYDQFRILKAQVYFKWQGSALDTTQLQTSVLLQRITLSYFPDYDDATLPNASEFHERSTTRYKTISPGRVQVIACKPAVLGLAYESTVANAYTPKWRQWLDMGDNATPYYGMKFGFEYPGLTAMGSVSTWIKLTFQCKG